MENISRSLPSVVPGQGSGGILKSQSEKSVRKILSPDAISLRSKSSTLSPKGSSFASSRQFHQSSKKSISSRISQASSIVSQRIKNPLDNLTNFQLLRKVQELEKNIKHMDMENLVFLQFLRVNEPTMIEAMDISIKEAEIKEERASISVKRMSKFKRESIIRRSSMNMSSLGLSVDKEGPRINIAQKADIVLRHIDDIEAELQKQGAKCHIIRHRLKADLEEMSIREGELEDQTNTFENAFICGTLDKYPQKNPADRFARFMEDYFKQNRLIRDKIRLRTSSLKVQYHKICHILAQKKLLGENLQEVDFEQLQIANRRLNEKIDKRNLLLIELKKMNGTANLLLSRTKKTLFKRLTEFRDVQDTIKFREGLILKLDEECEKVSGELDNAKNDYDKIKTKKENYQVPSVLDYVHAKAELSHLKKNLKVWARRKQIKDMALTATIRAMKSIATSKQIQADKRTSLDMSDNIFEFKFEKKARQIKSQRLAKISKRRINK